MKTKLLLLLLFVTIIINAQTNLVPNGDFENWTSSSQPNNWFRYLSGFTSESTSAQNGSSSTNMMIADGTFNYINSEYFPVVANKTYRITLYHKLVSGSFSAIDFSLYHKPSVFKSEIIKKTDATFSSNEWRKIEFDYTSTVSENIEVDIWTTGTLNSEILVDNVSVIDVAELNQAYTLIPDLNFENKLIALGIDSAPANGKVATNNIDKLTSLNVSNSSIADLTGIQDFVALQLLDCQKNNLTSLDVSNNINLTEINCSKNQINNINLLKNTELIDFNCDTNLITTLDFSKNSKLENISCYNNLLTNLNITSNVSLTELNCGKNKLVNLNVTKNVDLVNLICHYNQITNIDVSHNTKLVWFMCHFNELTSIDVSNNPKLDLFDCLNNKITSLDISKNPLITELACENNQLTYLNLKNGANTHLLLTFSNFINNPNLKCIQVDDVAYSNAKWGTKKDATASYNTDCQQYTLIPDVNFEKKLIALGIDSGATDGKVLTNNVNKLTTLDVSSSSITDLTGIQDFVALTYLDCYDNQITALDVSKNEKLTDLNCSSNKLTNFINTSNLGLKSLSCYSNQLTSLDVTKYTLLTYLYFSSNKITTIDLSSNNMLVRLWCDSNFLSELNVTNNPSLIVLNCGTNKLINLNVTKNVALTDLYCDNNQIKNIDVSQNNKLETFLCNFNEFTSIDVSNNPKLEYFYCSGNKITSLDISKNPLITELSCENNQLTYLNLKNGANTRLVLKFFNFKNNPNLTCIQVDDVAYSNAEWGTKKDAKATYSVTCTTLGIEDSAFDKIAIYPNPTKGELHIDNIVLKKATVYDALGKLVKTTTFTSGTNDNTINLAGLPKGIYYVYLESEGANTAKKIIVE